MTLGQMQATTIINCCQKKWEFGDWLRGDVGIAIARLRIRNCFLPFPSDLVSRGCQPKQFLVSCFGDIASHHVEFGSH